MKKLKDLGFEKVPTEDGFQMFVLEPSKLKEKKPVHPPEPRVMQQVHWQGKNYLMPFQLDLETDKGKIITIQNRFGGDSANIPWFAAAVYDVIMGAERTEDWDLHAQGLDWFGENFPTEYMTLLD